MRSRFFRVFLGVAMGWTIAGVLAGAASLQKDGRKPDQTAPPYTTNRVVALQKGKEDCPTIPGWPVESLKKLARRISRSDQDVYEYGRASKNFTKLEDLLHKYDLDRVCIYTATDPAAKFPPPQSVGLETADKDRMALISTGSTTLGAIGDQTWPTLADDFLDKAGKVRLAPAAAPSVRVVFVDTHPTHEGPPMPPVSSSDPHLFPSWHGHGMASLANEMVCGHEFAWRSCAIHVATRLALRHDEYRVDMPFPPYPGPEDEKGGHLGLVGDLGVAILSELYNWQLNYPDTKLILNLSVGWDGERQGKDLDAKKAQALETSSRMVYSSLKVASHMGVLVIAAAGNRTGGERSNWPLLPAAWELHPPSCLPFSLSKVVYAVGGVDWQGLPLPNSRPGGKPWRVAYGDHAVARTSVPSKGEEPTKMYTGTSVSTAVVSSIAAVAWHLRPDLTPAQVMKLIGHAGKVRSDRADFYAWKHFSWLIGPHLRQLSLCRTLRHLCGPNDSSCRPKLETRSCPIPDDSAAHLSGITPLSSTIVPFKELSPPPSCATIFMGVGAPVSEIDDCPMEKLPDMVLPYEVATQPPENPCPTCSIVPDHPAALSAGVGGDGGGPPYAVVVAIDPEWQATATMSPNNTTISSAVLVVDCSAMSPGGELHVRSDIRDRIPPSPESVRIRLDDRLRRSLKKCTASVDFRLTLHSPHGPEERSVQSPVYVDP